MSELPTVNQCYAMIIQDESQRELSCDHYNIGGQTDPTALFTTRLGGSSFGNQGSRDPGSGGYDSFRGQGNGKTHRPQRGSYLYCDHCDMKGHSLADCNKLKYYTHCHKHGHLKEVCYQLIGYPASYKEKKIANLVTSDFGAHPHIPGGLGAGSVPYIAPNQYNQVLQMLNKPLIHDASAANSANSSAIIAGIFVGKSISIPSTSSFNWIVSSGETDHIVGTESLLNHGLTVKSSGQVQLPNGDSAKVTQSGCSQLQGGDVVKNVLCVPEFNFNLLSMAKLTRQLNCCAIFYPDYLLLQDLFTGKVKEIGEEDSGLYILKPYQLLDTGQHRSFAAASKDSDEGDVWHKRLGHIPMSDIISLEDSQVPAQLPLTIISDAHPSNAEEYQNDPIPEDPTPEDNLPTPMHTPAITEEPVMNSIDYNSLSHTYQGYIANISVNTEPQFYHQAVKDKRWIAAMKEEIQALEDNKTWEIVSLPPGKKAIGCK
ncbi:hypothetical protein KY285_023136 [Solanum tuberosum]|nr:hypothetical protein KY285_023136 [Solanum tuberosum]